MVIERDQHGEDTFEGPQGKGELALGTTQRLRPLPRSWGVQCSHGAASVVGPSGATPETSRLVNVLSREPSAGLASYIPTTGSAGRRRRNQPPSLQHLVLTRYQSTGQGVKTSPAQGHADPAGSVQGVHSS